MRSLITLAIRTRRPLAELMDLPDEILATYFDVIDRGDKEARADGRQH